MKKRAMIAEKSIRSAVALRVKDSAGHARATASINQHAEKSTGECVAMSKLQTVVDQAET
jgi:hypothetical protein